MPHSKMMSTESCSYSVCFQSQLPASGKHNQQDVDSSSWSNHNVEPDEMKKYMVYAEVPALLKGDYKQPSCLVGNLIRFHFLLRMPADEIRSPLRLSEPTSDPRPPIVNFAVIHKPVIEDETALGPIPKVEGVKNALMQPGNWLAPNKVNKVKGDDKVQAKRQKRLKKYFMYCEVPKVKIGEFRKPSILASEFIYAHFLVRMPSQESETLRLRPVKKYRKPRVNFAVIHRMLVEDQEAKGPIPLKSGARSPMIKDFDGDSDDDIEDRFRAGMGDQFRAKLGFVYSQAPAAQRQLTTHWSFVRDASGMARPQLVLSRAI